jgi:diadenosine tetraphosphate (Ap4A) HIT family hydrolase
MIPDPKTSGPKTSDPKPEWSLHPQLAADTHLVGDLRLSRLLIIKDSNYPWLILVPRQPGVSEILDLSAADQARLMEEIGRTGRALKEITACDKLNIAALGNVVTQLHVHVIARSRNDPAWPQPVWGKLKPKLYDGRSLDAFAALLRKALTLG